MSDKYSPQFFGSFFEMLAEFDEDEEPITAHYHCLIARRLFDRLQTSEFDFHPDDMRCDKALAKLLIEGYGE